jgi:DNA-binding transcriptional regulator YiaG
MSPEQQYFATKIEELARRLESAEARVDRLSARLAVVSAPFPATLARYPPGLPQPESAAPPRLLSPVREWTGGEATALRKSLRMTESKFATVLSVSLRTVANWASNPATVPRAAAQDMLDELLADASPAVKAKFELVRLTA